MKRQLVANPITDVAAGMAQRWVEIFTLAGCFSATYGNAKQQSLQNESLLGTW